MGSAFPFYIHTGQDSLFIWITLVDSVPFPGQVDVDTIHFDDSTSTIVYPEPDSVYPGVMAVDLELYDTLGHFTGHGMAIWLYPSFRYNIADQDFDLNGIDLSYLFTAIYKRKYGK
jgi:hypothetical protein